MPYPTTAELVAASTVEALTTLTTAQQDSLRVASIAAIEEFCNQSFDHFPAQTRYVDGTGNEKLYLPQRLIAMTAIDAGDSGILLGDVVISAEGDFIYVKHDSLTSNYYTRVLNDLMGGLPMRFSYGTQNISITGDWGWVDSPAPVDTAIRKDMEDTALADSLALNETIRAYRKVGIADISQGDLRASVTTSPGLSDEVVQLLMPYVWQGRLGVVV